MRQVGVCNYVCTTTTRYVYVRLPSFACVSDLTLLLFASPDYRVRLEQSTVKLESLSLSSREVGTRRKLQKKSESNRNLYDIFFFFKRISIF